MIAFLSGTLLEKQANSAILDVGGVGYELAIPLSTFYELGEAGTEVSLRVYTHVCEDAIQLFGFKSIKERNLFLRLISVQGIGPKLGIGMLSGMSADEMITAIRTDNVIRIKTIPGVGQKTAERVVIELRDKIAELGGAAVGSGGRPEDTTLPSGEAFDDALSALVNLGYQKAAAEKALKQAAQEGTEVSVQKMLRRGLQILAR